MYDTSLKIENRRLLKILAEKERLIERENEFWITDAGKQRHTSGLPPDIVLIMEMMDRIIGDDEQLYRFTRLRRGEFESGIWQTSMIISMIRDRMGINVHPRTLRRTLRHVGISFRKPRPVPHNSASEQEQAEFKKNTQCIVDQQVAAGHTVLYQDEMTLRLAAVSARGWMLRGTNPTVKIGFSKKSIKVFGVLGQDRLHIMPAGAANSTTFIFGGLAPGVWQGNIHH